MAEESWCGNTMNFSTNESVELCISRVPVRQQNKHIYDELQTDKFFSIRMVGVENSKRGMGVATELIRRSNILSIL